MNELSETFNVFELLGIGFVAIGIFIPCVYICWRFIYRMWCIVDDAKVKDGEYWEEVTWLTWVWCAVLWVVLSICIILFRQVIVHIPIDVYLWTGAFAGSIYGLRYLRRLHKAIHGHIKNPDAHTPKEIETNYVKKMEEEERRYRRCKRIMDGDIYRDLREEHFHEQFR